MKLSKSVVLLLYFISTGTVLSAQASIPVTISPSQSRRNQAAREDGDIELSITSNNLSIAAGKPLILDILFKNISGEPFWFHSIVEHNEAQLNGFVVSVINSSGEELPLLPQKRLGARSRGVYTLQPKQVLHDGLIVNNLVDITHPGSYAVQVKWKYHNSENMLFSNILHITITPN